MKINLVNFSIREGEANHAARVACDGSSSNLNILLNYNYKNEEHILDMLCYLKLWGTLGHLSSICADSGRTVRKK